MMHFNVLILAFCAFGSAFPQDENGKMWAEGESSSKGWGKDVNVKNIKNINGGTGGGVGGNLQVGGGGGGSGCDAVACDIQV